MLTSGPSSGQLNIGGILSGTGGVSVGGSGSVVLSGASTFSGGATLTSGSLQIGASSTTSGSGSGLAITNGPTGTGLLTLSAGTLDLAGFNLAVGGLAGTGGTIGNSSTSTSSLLTIVAGASSQTYSGTIQNTLAGGTQTVAVTLAGNAAGTEIFAAANSYSGGISIASATLRLSGSGTLGSGGLLTVSAGRLDLAGVSLTGGSAVGGISDGGSASGTITSTSGTPTLTDTLPGSGTQTFSGTITGSLALAVSSSGTGVQVLSGSSNTYSGGTTVNSGMLQVTNSGGSATGTGNVTVSGSGALSGGGFIVPGGGKSVTIQNGGTIVGTTGSLLTITGTLNLTNSSSAPNATFTLASGSSPTPALISVGTLNVSGSVTVNITNGSLQPNTYDLINYTSGPASSGGGAAANFTGSSFPTNWTLTTTGSQLDLVVTSVPLTWGGQNGSAWDSSTTNWFNGSNPTTYSDGSAIAFGDKQFSGGPAVTSDNITMSVTGGVAPSSVKFNNTSGGVAYTVTSSDSTNKGITGSTGLTLAGTGMVTLNGINTYTGATQITGGGTLVVSANTSFAFGSGAGNIVLAGGGTLRAAGSFALAANRGSTLGVTSFDNGAIDVSSGNTLNYAGAIVDSGGGDALATTASGGTLILTGASTYTGVTNVNGGTLQLGDGSTANGSLTSSSVVVASGATLAFFPVSSGSFSSVVSGQGSLLLGSFATLTLTPASANSYSGGTTVAKGTLQLGNTNAWPNGTPLTIGGTGTSGTLDLNGFEAAVSSLSAIGVNPSQQANQTIINSNTSGRGTLATLTYAGGLNSSSFSGTLQETGGPQVAVKVTSGTLSLAGPNNYSGNTTVSGAGTLNANGTATSGFFPTSSTGLGNVTVNSGGTLAGNGAVLPIGNSTNSVTVNSGGTLAQLIGTATLTINGPLTMAVTTAGINPIASFTLPTSGPGGSPLFSVNGLLTIPAGGNAVNVNILNPSSLSLANNQVYDLLNYTSGPASSGTTQAANFSLLTPAPAGFTWQLQTTGSQLDLVVQVSNTGPTSTSYTLAASTAAAIIHSTSTLGLGPSGSGKTTTLVNSTITNSGASGADALDYSGLSLVIGGGSDGNGSFSGASSGSGSGLAQGATSGSTGFTNGSATFSSSGKGLYTINPTATSVLNHDTPPGNSPGPGNSPANTSTTVQVNYYAQPAFSLNNGSAGSNLSGALTRSGASYTLTLNVPTTTTGSPTASLALANGLIDSMFQDTLGGSLVFTNAAGSYLSPSPTLNGGTLTPINPGSVNSGAQPLTLTYANAVAAQGPQAAGSIAYTASSGNSSGSTTLNGGSPLTINLQVELQAQTGLTSYNGSAGAPGTTFGAAAATWSVQNNATAGGANSYTGLLSQVTGQTTGGAGAANGYGPLLHSTTQTAAGLVGSGAPLYAQIIAGSNSGSFPGTSPATVAMAWRNRTVQETSSLEGGMPASPPLQYVGSYLISNVLNLSGMTITTGEPVQTDPFVLQMSYDMALLSNESGQAKKGTIYLGWLNPNGGGTGVAEWQKAYTGDFNSSGQQTGAAANGTDVTPALGINFQGSFATFLSQEEANHPTDFPGSPAAANLTAAELSLLLGAYGVQTSAAGGPDVWAVINHNSQFAVVPEPSTLLLAALGLAGVAGYRVRRRRWLGRL